MDFDFNWILVPVTVLFFIIWLLDKILFKQFAQRHLKAQSMLDMEQQLQQAKQALAEFKLTYPNTEPSAAQDKVSQAQVRYIQAQTQHHDHHINTLISWAYDFWPVLAVVLVVRSFLFEPFNIPSESMNPTLETGDFILVNKYAFGVRLPLINTKILDTGEPQHGDVTVFRYPEQPSISFIKRIIGLPGDHIRFQQGNLYVNGTMLVANVEQRDVPLPIRISLDKTVNVNAEQWRVTFGQHHFLSQYIQLTQTEPLAMQVMTLMNNNQANPPFKQLKHEGEFLPLSLNQDWQITVPQGQYFAMGDNRDQSDDSRYWGFVPEANLTGKAVYLWMHKQPGLHIPSFSRNGLIP